MKSFVKSETARSLRAPNRQHAHSSLSFYKQRIQAKLAHHLLRNTSATLRVSFAVCADFYNHLPDSMRTGVGGATCKSGGLHFTLQTS
jgi:hypothetical protein